MGVTKMKAKEFAITREEVECKNMKTKKIHKKLKEIFSKLNKTSCYDFFEDPKSNSYHNLLLFLTYVEKACIDQYGKQDKYKKQEVQAVLEHIFYDVSERACKTMREIDKVLKKSKDENILGFRFNGLIKGKIFYSNTHTSDERETNYNW